VQDKFATILLSPQYTVVGTAECVCLAAMRAYDLSPLSYACLAAIHDYCTVWPFTHHRHSCLAAMRVPTYSSCRHGMFVLTSITQPQPAVQHAQSARVSSVFV